MADKGLVVKLVVRGKIPLQSQEITSPFGRSYVKSFMYDKFPQRNHDHKFLSRTVYPEFAVIHP